MPQLDNCPWLKTTYQMLIAPFMINRGHHGMLINYVKGSGEDILIQQFVMQLLCQSSDINQQTPCNHCHSCQLFIANNHPDYYIIEPQDGKLSIGVEQIRTITPKIYEHAQQGGKKVVWIKSAGSMTEAAANAVLKTLEEPPENTYFILSEEHNRPLLATIRSRCIHYFITVPELEQSCQWLVQYDATLSQYSDNELASALLLCELAPLAAQQLLTPTKWQQRQQFCQSLLTHMPTGQLWSIRQSFLNDDLTIEKITWFCSLLSDALKATQKAGRFIVNRDQVPLVRLLASFGHDVIIKLYQQWQTVRSQLLTITALNQELIISNLLAQSECTLTS